MAVAVFGTYLFLVLALRDRRTWLPVGIAFNLALLAFFKYKLLFVDPASPSLVDFAPLDFLLKLPLPIGISFFVFHNISLLVDLTGGSPVTGLEIVANQPRLPAVILVEANVLSRTTDTALVERYSRGDTEPLFFRPVRAAVVAYEQRLHAPLTHEQVAIHLRKLVEQPPSDFDSRVYEDRALQEFNAHDPADAVRTHTKRIEELIRKVEQRGTRVLLFELPYSEPIGSSRAAKITREIIHAGLSDPHRWLRIDANRSELRWADGVHLDARSAVIVTQAMERALTSARGAR